MGTRRKAAYAGNSRSGIRRLRRGVGRSGHPTGHSPEAADPLLGEVGWSWLSEALDARVPGYAVPSGTVTRVITEGFGAKQDEVPLTGFELRASWSPTGPGHQPGFTGHDDLDALDLSAHIAAWCDCLSAAAGLEPPGTRALRQPGHG